jgi:hypothetical protein
MTGLEISHQLRDIAAGLAYLRPAEAARDRLLALADIAMTPVDPRKDRATRARIGLLEGRIKALQAERDGLAGSVKAGPPGSRIAARIRMHHAVGYPARKAR